MGLIICPECKKDISEYTERCPNCGCPMDKIRETLEKVNSNLPDNVTCVICGVTRPKSELCANNYKCRVCGSDVRLTIEENLKRDNDYQSNNIVNKKDISMAVTCPYCNSANTIKISTTKRSLSTYLFGLGSSKVGKQWHCNDCKSDF